LKKKVREDGCGGYYYVDDNDEYHECDVKGNSMDNMKTGHPSSDRGPRRIVLVYANAQRETYYVSRGKLKRCLLKKGQKPGSYYFVDSKGRERNAQYVGAEPRGMDGDSSPVSECSQ
jgi:hypothetical protein